MNCGAPLQEADHTYTLVLDSEAQAYHEPFRTYAKLHSGVSLVHFEGNAKASRGLGSHTHLCCIFNIFRFSATRETSSDPSTASISSFSQLASPDQSEAPFVEANEISKTALKKERLGAQCPKCLDWFQTPFQQK